MKARTLIPAALLRYVGRLRYPTLLGITAVLFAVDLIVPDMIPMVDEVLLGLGTALFASWKERRGEPAE